MKKILLLLTVMVLNFNSFAAVDDPVMPVLPNLWACSNQPIFDLNSNTSIILSAQVLPNSNYTVTYHLTAADANAGAQEITTPWAYFGWNEQVIWARVTKNVTNTFAVGSFTLLFFPPGVPTFLPIPSVCLGSVAPTLPSVSTNNFFGTWSPATIITSVVGVITYTFTPEPGQCVVPTTMTITTVNCDGLEFYPFIDTNSNGIKDSGEVAFPYGQFQYEMNNNGTINFGSSPNGIYSITETNAANSYNVNFSINAPFNSYYNVTTSSYANVHITPGMGLTTLYFPVTVSSPYTDLLVDIIPTSVPRPGFTFMNRVAYTNFSNQTVVNGAVSYQHDPIVSITSISQTGTTTVGNGFTYNFTNLLPFETRFIDVTLQCPTIPTVALGQLLNHSAAITPVAGDIFPINNATTETQTIIGSYDPNDKTESHGPSILFSGYNSNDYFNYTIRFENTGTANALTVRVDDVLDSMLDETTIRTISASHPYVFNRVNTNLSWRFDNIQLPPSVANTNIGHGYVTFQVKLKPGYAVGDVIPNVASIFFDFNPAIITNTFQSEFVNQLNLNQSYLEEVTIYPNPTSQNIQFDNSNLNYNTVVVYTTLGQELKKQKLAFSSNETIEMCQLASGLYLLQFTGEFGTSTVKIVKN